MASAPLPSEPDVTHCARHPAVETYLRCGRCDTPICPRCLIQTPVGARCRDCARVRASPPYDVSPVFALRGGAAALGGALVGGVAVQLAAGLLPFGLLGLLLFGLIYGVGVARLVGLATNNKRGPLLGWITVVAITVGYCLSRAALFYLQLGALQGADRLGRAIALGFRLDLGVLLLLIAAALVAYGRLR